MRLLPIPNNQATLKETIALPYSVMSSLFFKGRSLTLCQDFTAFARACPDLNIMAKKTNFLKI